MTAAIQDTIGSILNHYADVIEGGNSYASGSAYRGIPGTRSVFEWITKDGTIAATATTDTTTLTSSELHRDLGDDLARTEGPPFFVRCTAATNGANVGAARKVTAYSPNSLTVAAFPAAITEADTFAVMEGFRRIEDNYSLIDDEEGPVSGFDRYFHLEAGAGSVMPWYGLGKLHYTTTLQIKLRLLKHARELNAAASAFENLGLMRTIITRSANPDHRDGTYVVALIPEEGNAELLLEDDHKVVVQDSYQLIYRVNSVYL